MRIALVTDYYPPTLGGVQTAVKTLADALAAAGHDVTVFCPLSRASADDTPSVGPGATGPEVVALPVSRVFRPDGYPFAWSPSRVRAVLRREFAARGIEVVHTHSEMIAALSAVRVAQDLGLPIVHTMHGRIDVYTANVLPLPSLTTVLLARMHSRQISHAGIMVAADAPYTATRTARRMWRLMLAQARISTHVVVPSEHFAEKFRARGVLTPMTVLSNGLEASVLTSVGAPTVRSLGAGEKLRIVWVGRLSPEKRPEVVVAAARSLPRDVSVDLFGDGVARAPVAREAARATSGAHVTLHGPVAHAEVLEAMRSAHLLVSSSYDFDNQPMVMLEATATGLPVLFCDPDLAEVVPPGGGFRAVSPDAQGIVEAVTGILSDPAAIERASAAQIEAREGVAQPAAGMLAVYEAAREAARDHGSRGAV